MAETVAEIAVCASCGAEVRDQSVFCYNCGKRVRGDSEAMPIDELATDEVAKPEAKPERPPLRSAASLRKSRRAYNRQPVEVKWTQRQGSPMSFIVTTAVLAIGALVLLILALYLR